MERISARPVGFKLLANGRYGLPGGFSMCEVYVAKKMRPSQTRKSQPNKMSQQSVFQEAWSNMMGDIDRFLPEKLKGGEGKKKFVLWLFILELVVLGVIGKLVYEWIRG